METTKKLVWNMHTAQWVVLKHHMRYMPFIWTKGVTPEEWEQARR